MQKRLPGALSGLKKGRPWMWSQWVCESRMSAASAGRRVGHELVAERTEAAARIEDDETSVAVR